MEQPTGPLALSRRSRLEGLDAAARLLRSKTNRYAWIGLGISVAALVVATLLSCRYECNELSWAGIVQVQSTNPALWLLDLMPLAFVVWGQYIGTMMSYQAGALLIDETHALREQTTILQHELERGPATSHALGLPNRHVFLSSIGRAIARRRLHGEQVAILTLDTEQFHELEQSQGEESAMQLLTQLRERLKSVLGDNDLLTHFGHDDFGILLPQIADESEARRFASRIQLALDMPMQIGRQLLGARVSIGIALHPAHGDDPESLIRHAEVAKYAAAEDQRDYRVYDPTLDHARSEGPRRIAELHAALYNEGLGDDYQLQLPLRTGLPPRLRLMPYWNHPHHGRLEQPEFFSLPDRLSLVHALTLWQFREGLQRLAQWRSDGLRPDLGIVIHVPDAALRLVAVSDMVSRLLGSHDLPAGALTLELTESALIAGGAHARSQIAALRNAGTHICVIGAGQPGTSAVTSLYFPVDEVRLSSLPLQRAAREPEVRKVFATMLDVLLHLKQTVTLSGVDSAELRSFAAGFGAAYAEGVAIHARMTPDEVERWLAGGA